MASSWNKIPEGFIEPFTVVPTMYESVRAQIVDERRGLGLPKRYRDIEMLDCALVMVTWIGAILALVAIFNVTVAALLGQTYQLIVVGFLLSIIAYCLQGRSTKFLVAIEVLLGQSSLQNLEAILQMDCSSSGASFPLRLTIALLFALPLGLSVAYKSFTGGTTVTVAPTRLMNFGMTPPPGTNNTGYGLSLFSTTLLPFWSSPGTQTAYGYSMWSHSANTVAILDSPLEQNITDFQGSLRSDQSAVIEATVSAVQADMVMEWSNTTKEALNKTQLLDYLGYDSGDASLFATNDDLIKDYLSQCTSTTDYIYSGCRTAGLAYGSAKGSSLWLNNTFFAVSRSDTPYEPGSVDTFLNYTQGFAISLKRYRGTWNVTRDSATLLNAQLLPNGPLDDPKYDFSNVYATVFQDTFYRFELYMTMLVEFDWKYPWARFDLITCDKIGPAKYTSSITTDTAAIAAMVWSRVATKWGPTSAQYGGLSIDGKVKGDTKYSAEVETQIYTQTLKRRWPLFIVILAMPTLTTLVVVLQWLPPLRGSPVSNGFGLISLLAAVDSRGLGLLRGAEYSGKLSRKVCAIFSAAPPVDEMTLFSNETARDQSSVSVTLIPHQAHGGKRSSGIRLRTRSTYR